ncbi:hypothetical protein Goklo_025475, partial [Gossypium klotzschianum]|nr:hypothetical protein [Gossypium klotzschianum]
ESEKLFLREVFTSVQDSGSLSRYIRTYVFVIFSSPCSHREMYSPELNSYLDRELIMDKGFLDKVEDNAAVQIWSEKIQQEKGDSLAVGIYSRAANVLTFLKKLMNITGMSEQWVAARIKLKGDCKCIPWRNLMDLILAHLDIKKRVDVFALSIYGLVVFPKALGYINEAVSDLFDRLDKRVTPVPAILAETFRSLNACRRAGEGRFIGCAQLLLAWFHSHFWKIEKVSYRVFSEKYSPLKELVSTPRRDNILEEKWMAILQNLQDEDVEWIWGAIGYAPLLVLRQYRSMQFIPATQGLAQCEFSYKDDNYKKKVRKLSNAWNQARRMKSLAIGPMTTLEYSWWWGQRVNDKILVPNQEITRSLKEHLNLELGNKIEQLEEEKIQLGLDVDVQKLEADKLRKGKNNAEEDLDSLNTNYKNLRRSIRTVGLGKTSEQWRQEIKEEKIKADQWEKKARVVELEKSLHQYRSLNSAIELRTSLSKIKELKGKIRELEDSLQNCKLRIRDRDYIMGDAVAQVREAADHLQTLAVQVDMLSLRYELESDRGQELAWLLRKVKALGIRAK